MTNNEIIKLRSKPTGNGNRSLYLDLYYKGDRRYEFLHLYLVPERTKSDRLKNKKTLQLANAIKTQRTADFFNDLHGFPSKKTDVNLIQYIGTLGKIPNIAIKSAINIHTRASFI